ncbi:hypothetical protein [Mycolicibacterium phocaicum]|uniref:Uncharacterized protein n=1 Tax=Mycolicibacterium phocaicum TaxID=319706 RepID=A0A7I7ZUP3_9MYCO|nr:hypothetical protein [Mycolicibacterium phocaicum]TLH61044.1 hypothetical protein C1S79_26015 [Mycolicibacterium phocaicum]BBZ57023.1 hypothetical protein MPHO_40150 [Mycolicibacterium phocaicum]
MSQQCPRERIQASAAAIIDWLCTNGQADLASTRRMPPDKLLKPLRDAIVHGCRFGYVSSPDPDGDAQAILHLIVGMFFTHTTIGRPASRAELELAVMRTINGALGTR